MNSLLDNLYQDILSNLDEYIYVVNLDTFKIQYISPKLESLIPNYNKDLPCYCNVANLNTQCLTCPYRFLSVDNKSIALNTYNPLFSKPCNSRYLYSVQNDTPFLTVILSPEKAALQEEDIRRDEMYKVLTNITRLLGPTENVETRLSECLEDISAFYNADGCFFYQINRNTTYCNLNRTQDNSFMLDDKNTIKEWSVHFSQNRVLQSSKDKSLYYTNRQSSMLGIDEIIAVCVKRSGAIVGFLYVINPKKNEDLTILLSSAAPFIETEFDEDDKTSRLDYLAYTDFMTGLKNRTSYNEILAKLEGDDRELGIVFIDINGLKQGNDTYGHEYGDKMIKTVASDLKSFFKKSIYRIGGDEFVIFVSGKNREDFETLVDRYKTQMQKEISVSLGFKWFKDSSHVEQKISEVDKLMYAEKVKYHTTHDRRKHA